MNKFDTIAESILTESYSNRKCPICEGKIVSRCKCSKSHDMDSLKKGHGILCENGHRYSYDKDGELISMVINESKTYNIDKGDYDHNDFKEGDTLVYTKKKYKITDLMGDNEFFRIKDLKTGDNYSISMMKVDDGPKEALEEL